MYRWAALFSVVAVAVVLVAGCSPYQPLDPTPYLRERIAELAGEELSAGVEVPFELDYEVRAVVEERLSPAGSERRRTEDILDLIFGWLDLEYSLNPTRNAVETFRARQGNCLSFVNLFVGVARKQRLNPFYVEVEDYQRWNYRDGVVVSRGHIVAGMYVDGQLATYDFLPYRPKSYRDFKPIDDLMATAHYYNNLGAEALMRGEQEVALSNLRVAADLAPDFDKVLNNLGIALLRAGQLEEAADLYERALELHPDYVPILTNLARVYQELGQKENADELLTRLEGINQSNPFFFVYRGDLALGQGDHATALDYMRRALKADSEVPEVHVGLVRVYLAMGELAKARHHVGRALKLDATHGEARKYAALISRGEDGVE